MDSLSGPFLASIDTYDRLNLYLYYGIFNRRPFLGRYLKSVYIICFHQYLSLYKTDWKSSLHLVKEVLV